MARIRLAPGRTVPDTERRITVRGAFYVRETKWGLVAQAWPRKRPNWKNPVNLAQREAFTAMVRAQQDMMVADVVGAMGIARGSYFLYRDVLERALTGRLIAFDPVSVATPQEILDSITDEIGAILIRTSDGWAGLSPGDAGTVLSVDALTGLPIWADSAGGLNFTDAGTFDSAAEYNPGDVVQFAGTAALCWSHVDPVTGAAQVWDSAHSGASTLHFSATNLTDDTVQNASGGGNHTAVGTAPKTAGKWYFEAQIVANSDNNSAVMVVDTTFSLGTYAQAIGTIGSSAGGGSGSWPGFSAGARVGVAVDLDANKISFCNDVTAGSLNWNGSTSNDPATGTGAIALPATVGGAVPAYPAWNMNSNQADKASLFTLPADLLIAAIPSGFSPMTAGSLNPDPPDDPAHWLV